MALTPPTVQVSGASVSSNSGDVDPLHAAKVTAVLLIVIDVALVIINASNGAFGLTNTALWSVCLLIWCISLMLTMFGIVTNRTLLFVPCYIVWCVTFVCSVIFIIVDGYAYTYCDDSVAPNETGRWISPCEVYRRTHYPYSGYLLLLLLKMVQLFHVRTLARDIDARVMSKISVASKKDNDSDDDDMVVFEKVGGVRKGSKAKISDATRASIS